MRPRRKKARFDAVALPMTIGGLAIAAADATRRAYRHNQLFCPSPEPLRSWNPADYGIPDGSVEEQWIPAAGGETLHAWYCRAPNPVASGLYCHGNTGNLTTTADVIPHLLEAGLSILFFDYRGFGRSSGRPSVRGVVADGLAAARLHDALRPHHLPAVLYGFSLGGAVAAQVLRRHPFDGVILQSTFTSLSRLTRLLYPRLPMYLLAGGIFDTAAIVARLEVPLLVLHGTDDEAIPCSMADELYDACPSAKRTYSVKGGLHKDLFDRDPQGVVRAISDFIGSLEPAPERGGTPEPDDFRGALQRLRRAVRL